MFNRRHLIASAFAITLSGLASAVLAADMQAYDVAAFAAAQKAGKGILVEVSAPWCPTCQAQKPILSGLFAKPEYKGLVVFEVDFDSRKDVLKQLNVRMQSTLIVFKGTVETGRSVGDTDPAAIAALLSKSI